jgi:hypothetical protein
MREKLLSDIDEPSLRKSRTESVEPRRTKLRSANVDPKCT